MSQIESIYNLIPPILESDVKPPLYKSKYPPHITPTASTFGINTTSFPGSRNHNGYFEDTKGAHPYKKSHGTFGKREGSYKPNPETFIKKGHQYIERPVRFILTSSKAPRRNGRKKASRSQT